MRKQKEEEAKKEAERAKIFKDKLDEFEALLGVPAKKTASKIDVSDIEIFRAEEEADIEMIEK